jgi:hypothetical protein
MDNFKFVITRTSTPSQPGFMDLGELYNNEIKIWSGPCSSCPNSVQPESGQVWDLAYAILDFGDYPGKVINDNGHGMCIELNNLGNVNTLLPNSNHGHAYFATEVLVHKGSSMTWRGSKCCCTIQPDVYPSLFALLPVGSSCTVTIVKP